MNVFEQGKKAFKKGDIGNPYPANTTNNRNWEHGFNTEYFKCLEKQKQYESAQANT